MRHRDDARRRCGKRPSTGPVPPWIISSPPPPEKAPGRQIARNTDPVSTPLAVCPPARVSLSAGTPCPRQDLASPEFAGASCLVPYLVGGGRRGRRCDPPGDPGTPAAGSPPRARRSAACRVRPRRPVRSPAEEPEPPPPDRTRPGTPSGSLEHIKYSALLPAAQFVAIDLNVCCPVGVALDFTLPAHRNSALPRRDLGQSAPKGRVSGLFGKPGAVGCPTGAGLPSATSPGGTGGWRGFLWGPAAPARFLP